MREVTIIKETVFTIQIGDQKFDGLRKVSQWEGFAKLANDKHVAIVRAKNADGFGGVLVLFRDILDPGERPETWELVAASREIAEAFKASAEKEAATSAQPAPCEDGGVLEGLNRKTSGSFGTT